MSTFSIFYEQECHKDSFRKVAVKPAHVEKKSYYLIPKKDIQLEKEKALPDLDWPDPYEDVFKHLIIKNPDVKDKETAYLHEDLGDDPDCIKTNEGLNTEYKNLCLKIGATYSNLFIKSLRTKNIVLNYCGLNQIDFYAICQALNNNISINTLDVGENNIGTVGAYYLAQLLENLEIVKLRLDSNHIDDFGFMALLKALMKSEIDYLSVSNNAITDKSLPLLGDVLRGEKSKIKDLFLAHNKIGFNPKKSARDFKNMFRDNISLDSINLSWNSINGDQAIGLFNEIKSYNNISILDLSHNAIKNDVCRSIGNCLKVNQSLQSLDISSNFIGLDGAKQISIGLKNNECLNTLKIGKNPINLKGIEAILTAINNDKSAIINLDFEKLEVSDTMVSQIEEMKKGRELNVIYGHVTKNVFVPW